MELNIADRTSPAFMRSLRSLTGQLFRHHAGTRFDSQYKNIYSIFLLIIWITLSDGGHSFFGWWPFFFLQYFSPSHFFRNDFFTKSFFFRWSFFFFFLVVIFFSTFFFFRFFH